MTVNALIAYPDGTFLDGLAQPIQENPENVFPVFTTSPTGLPREGSILQ